MAKAKSMTASTTGATTHGAKAKTEKATPEHVEGFDPPVNTAKDDVLEGTVDTASESTAVQQVQSGALTGALVPVKAGGVALIDDNEYDAEDLGEGFQNVAADEYITPYIVLLQKGSPQTNKQKAEYVTGAEPGMYMDSVTHKLYPNGVTFVPIHREKFEVEWSPRDQGGGMIERHNPDDPEIKALRDKHGFGKIEGFGDGNELCETYYLYIGVVDPDTNMISRAVIAFASTQVGAYKRLVSIAREQKVLVDSPRGPQPMPLPLYAHVYLLTSQYTEKNNFDWFKMVINFAINGDAKASRIDKRNPVFNEAKHSRALATSGALRIADTTVSQETVQQAEVVGEAGEM